MKDETLHDGFCCEREKKRKSFREGKDFKTLYLYFFMKFLHLRFLKLLKKAGRALTLPSIKQKSEQSVFEKGFTFEFEIIYTNFIELFQTRVSNLKG